jgi:hypothetical protein
MAERCLAAVERNMVLRLYIRPSFFPQILPSEHYLRKIFCQAKYRNLSLPE